ncbi:MAG: winged helix-turn-helix transcriptional regulator [Akkermansia sp.]|nr:winged helix-turn-helix transcriptional regulator [Akkermansia sp.]
MQHIPTRGYELELTILQCIEEDSSVSAKQIAEKCGMSARQIEKYLAELKKKGVLHREGARKNGKWHVRYFRMKTDRLSSE